MNFLPPLPDTLPTLFQLGFYRWNVMKAFFSLPHRFLDLSPKGFIDLPLPLCFFASLQSGQLFGDFGSRLATP